MQNEFVDIALRWGMFLELISLVVNQTSYVMLIASLSLIHI